MNRIGTLALAVAQKLGVVKIYQNPSLLLLEYKDPPIYWIHKVTGMRRFAGVLTGFLQIP